MEDLSEGGCLVVSLKEKRLDAVIAASFREALVARIDEGQRSIVLDMSQVSFMDSSGLGAVVYVLIPEGCTSAVSLPVSWRC
jgi:anti-sigma B factor antagonist